jgi:hypothetical protein
MKKAVAVLITLTLAMAGVPATAEAHRHKHHHATHATGHKPHHSHHATRKLSVRVAAVESQPTTEVPGVEIARDEEVQATGAEWATDAECNEWLAEHPQAEEPFEAEGEP